MAQLALDDTPGQGNALLAKFNGTPDGFSEEPILSIQDTRFGCGSVSLGVRLNQCLRRTWLSATDGRSRWNLPRIARSTPNKHKSKRCAAAAAALYYILSIWCGFKSTGIQESIEH